MDALDKPDWRVISEHSLRTAPRGIDMYLEKWFNERGLRFILKRGTSLLRHYGFGPSKTFRRIDECLTTLDKFGCAPTFFAPGIIVERYPRFIAHLQAEGAEIGVHGYEHIELSSLPVDVAVRQFERACNIFARYGIQVSGFRCPYIDCTDELFDAIPQGMFQYSSNRGIAWEQSNGNSPMTSKVAFKRLEGIYKAKRAKERLSIPGQRAGMLEIPVSFPDDLLLHQGLGKVGKEIGLAWIKTLEDIYERGELFNLLFHTELASLCIDAFVLLLEAARKLQPTAWIARLREISDWWNEKNQFAVEISDSPTDICVSFRCSPRATILARGIQSPRLTGWDLTYSRLEGNLIEVPAEPRPFVGLASSTPPSVTRFLSEQGYILDVGENAHLCATFLDESILAKLTTERELINHIEQSNGPMIRYCCWPDGAKSALSITGDLDALTLLDYFGRLFSK